MAIAATARPALVNGDAGLVNTIDDELISMSFTITHGRIVAINVLSDRDRWQHPAGPGDVR